MVNILPWPADIWGKQTWLYKHYNLAFQKEEIKQEILVPFYKSLTGEDKQSILQNMTSWTEDTPFGEMELAIECALLCLEKVSEKQVSLTIWSAKSTCIDG